MQLDQLTPEDFEALRGQTLALEAPAARIVCTLIEVRRLPAHGLRTAPPFALTLRGPLTPVLAQGTYRLDHPVYGPLALFAVPIGPDAEGMRYEVTFN
jgi:hypothetical protein